MKVLLFTLEYPPFKGGVANYYGNVVKHWPEPGNIYVLNNNDGRLLKWYIWPRWLPAIKTLKQVVKERHIQHILVGQILPLGTAALAVSKAFGISYTVFLHGMDFSYSQKSKRKRILSDRILKNAEHIVCGNNYTAKLLEQTYGEPKKSKVTVVNPGVNLVAAYDPKVYKKIQVEYNLASKFVVFSLGRLVARKGFANIIAAVNRAAKKIPQIHYFIAGEGPEKMNLMKQALENPHITVLGKISDKEKWAWLNACNVFALTPENLDGDFEGFGIVYLEANLAGKPVIATNSGGVADAVEQGINGIVVPPADPDKAAAAIITLFNDPAMAKRLGEQGRQRAINNFNWPKQIAKIYKFIAS